MSVGGSPGQLHKSAAGSLAPQAGASLPSMAFLQPGASPSPGRLLPSSLLFLLPAPPSLLSTPCLLCQSDPEAQVLLCHSLAQGSPWFLVDCGTAHCQLAAPRFSLAWWHLHRVPILAQCSSTFPPSSLLERVSCHFEAFRLWVDLTSGEPAGSVGGLLHFFCVLLPFHLFLLPAQSNTDPP